MTNEEYNKWIILYFDMQSINLQFNCNDIASSLKAQRDKIKQFCIDCLTGVKHQADSFLFDTNAHIFSTPKGLRMCNLTGKSLQDNADDLYWWYVTFSIDTTAI